VSRGFIWAGRSGVPSSSFRYPRRPLDRTAILPFHLARRANHFGDCPSQFVLVAMPSDIVTSKDAVVSVLVRSCARKGGDCFPDLELPYVRRGCGCHQAPVAAIPTTGLLRAEPAWDP
jgi:hypothetical protein